YDVGEADGAIGARTRQAVSEYQAHIGMTRDGRAGGACSTPCAPGASRLRSGNRSIVPLRLTLLCAAFLAAAAPVSAGLRCDGGSFVVQPGTRVLPGVPGSYDLVRVIPDGRRMNVSIDAACPPVRAHTAGRRIVARWPRGACGVPERVTLKLVLDAACEIARG